MFKAISLLMSILFFAAMLVAQETGVYVDKNFPEQKFKYSVKKGSSIKALKSNAANYYQNHWRAIALSQGGESEPLAPPEAIEIFKNPSKDISIEIVKEKIAVVEYSVTINAFDDIHRKKGIWVLTDGAWWPLPKQDRKSKIELYDINGDGQIDIFAWGGCCGWQDLTVLIGDKNGAYIQTQYLQFVGSPNIKYSKSCTETVLIHDEQDRSNFGDPAIPLAFDCSKLLFRK